MNELHAVQLQQQETPRSTQHQRGEIVRLMRKAELDTRRITFAKTVPSEQIARDLRWKRHELRDRVDAIDLAAMGVDA